MWLCPAVLKSQINFVPRKAATTILVLAWTFPQILFDCLIVPNYIPRFEMNQLVPPPTFSQGDPLLFSHLTWLQWLDLLKPGIENMLGICVIVHSRKAPLYKPAFVWTVRWGSWRCCCILQAAVSLTICQSSLFKPTFVMVLLCDRWYASCVQRLQTCTLTQNLQIPIAEMNKLRRQEVYLTVMFIQFKL